MRLERNLFLPRVFLLTTYYLLLSTSLSFAQKKAKKVRQQRIEVPAATLIYNDVDYIPEIKTVAFYNQKEIQSFPLLNLGSGEELVLSFDDLRGGSRNLYYGIVHCNADWTPSSISPIEYLESFGEDRINNYRFSYSTYKKYTHYEVKLPNFSVIPKLSGNYLLKVYEDGDPSKLLLTRRFYVLTPKVTVQAEIVPSPTVSNRDSHQKINFTVFHPSLNIQNAYQEITAVVLQNGRTDLSQQTQRPLFIRNNQLVYSDNSTTEFEGGNEFRRFDTRSFRYKSDGVYQIIQDSIYTVNLFADIDKSKEGYAYQFDEDGNFYTLNQDGSDPRYDADYGNINFVLKADPPSEDGFVYVVGKFNAYQKNQSNRMAYSAEHKMFTLTTLLKQGVVDYKYVWANADGKIINQKAFEGSYFQTENDYQILIYYRAPGARFDQLISYTELNSSENPRNF